MISTVSESIILATFVLTLREKKSFSVGEIIGEIISVIKNCLENYEEKLPVEYMAILTRKIIEPKFEKLHIFLALDTTQLIISS